MMASNEVSAPPDNAQWQSINWKAVKQHVLKLQMRIAKATREGKHGKAKHCSGYSPTLHQQNCLLLKEFLKIKAAKHQELTASFGTVMLVV